MARLSGRAPDSSVTSVNGKAGAVVLDGSDLSFTPTYAGTDADTVTTVAEMLEHNHTHLGTARIWWSEPTFARAAPITGTTYEMDTPTIGTAPVGGAPVVLPAGRDVDVAHPGSVLALGSVKVVLTGDVAGPLVSGELLVDGLTIGNTSLDPSARDLDMSSPSGRPIGCIDVTMVGPGGALVHDAGPVVLRGLVLAPQAPGSAGVEFDSNVGNVLVSGCLIQSPGGGYTGFSILGTATIDEQFYFAGNTIQGVAASDYLLHIDNSATLPGGPAPTSSVGVGVFGCSVIGDGDLFDPAGRGADNIQIVSRDHLNGPRSNFIGDALVDTSGTPPPILLSHLGSAGLPLVIPSDNSNNGGVGGTLRSLALTGSTERHTLLLGLVATASVNAGGTYTGGDGNYPATQASTSGSGTGAEFTVTLTGGTITAVVSVDEEGTGYDEGDTITLTVVGPTETVAAVLDVDALEWAMRTDGPVANLTGPVTWRADVSRSGPAGSTVYGYVERRPGGVGPWTEVVGSRSSEADLTLPISRVGGSTILKDIGPLDDWRLVWVNDVGGADTTLFHVVDLLVDAES